MLGKLWHRGVTPTSALLCRGRRHAEPLPSRFPFFRLDWGVKFDSKVLLICGKMAQIVCCTLDVFFFLHRWWDRRGRGLAERDGTHPSCPVAWHSGGYVHKGWTLLARTVPGHIHLICKDRTSFSVKHLHRQSEILLNVQCVVSEKIKIKGCQKIAISWTNLTINRNNSVTTAI